MTYGDNEATGSYRERHAGAAEYHPAHRHRHFKDMVLYELFAVAEVSPPTPYRQGTRLISVGTGRKHAWCAFSQRFENWFGFAQDEQFASSPARNTIATRPSRSSAAGAIRTDGSGRDSTCPTTPSPKPTARCAPGTTWSASASTHPICSTRRERTTTSRTPTRGPATPGASNPLGRIEVTAGVTEAQLRALLARR